MEPKHEKEGLVKPKIKHTLEDFNKILKDTLNFVFPPKISAILGSFGRRILKGS